VQRRRGRCIETYVEAETKVVVEIEVLRIVGTETEAAMDRKTGFVIVAESEIGTDGSKSSGHY